MDGPQCSWVCWYVQFGAQLHTGICLCMSHSRMPPAAQHCCEHCIGHVIVPHCPTACGGGDHHHTPLASHLSSLHHCMPPPHPLMLTPPPFRRCAILLDELDDYRGLRKGRALGHIVVETRTANAVPLLRYSCSKRVIALPTGQLNARRVSAWPVGCWPCHTVGLTTL